MGDIMKKFLRLFFLIGIILSLSSCSNVEEITDYIDVKKIEQDIRSFEQIDPKNLEIVAVLKGKEFTKANSTSVIINLAHIKYSFRDGVFSEEEGSSSPAELIYKKTADGYELENIIYPLDGSQYTQSVRKMTRNNNILRSKVDCFNEYGVVNALAKKAEDLGLKEFKHTLETIPKLDAERVMLPTTDENIVELGNLIDYNKERAEGDDHSWQYIDGIRFYINEGIAIAESVELNNHVELANLKKDIEKYKNISPEKSEFIAIEKFSEFIKDEEKHVIVDLYWGSFSFKNGLFKIDSHYETIAKVVYNTAGELVSFREAGSGTGFETAIKEMTDGNENLIKCIEKKKNHSPDYVQSMIEKAEELGLNNYIHTTDEIPGFSKDCVEIQTDEKGVVKLVKKKDFENCKKNLQAGESSYVEGVDYHSNSGIAIRTKVLVQK